MSSPTQTLLKTAGTHIGHLVPIGIRTVGSGGKGRPTSTPWIAFLDPDETKTTQEGIYAVYLYSSDRSTVALSVNQGVTFLSKRLGDRNARERLAMDAVAIRKAIEEEPKISGRWISPVRLGSKRHLQLAYEAGNIAAVTYATRDMPDEETLRNDLADSVELAQKAIDARDQLLLNEPGSLAAPAARRTRDTSNAEFRPKSADDYIATVQARTMVKSRKHESIVNNFAEHCRGLGYNVSTPHPRDLVVESDGQKFLVEVKVVRGKNPSIAVREAIGQLAEYEFFFHQDDPCEPVAVFSSDIGAAFVDLLTSRGIAAIWWDRDWQSASSHPLCPSPTEQL